MSKLKMEITVEKVPYDKMKFGKVISREFTVEAITFPIFKNRL